MILDKCTKAIQWSKGLSFLSDVAGEIWYPYTQNVKDCIFNIKAKLLISRTEYLWPSVQLLSCVWLFATPWIAACQASLSITNSRSLLKFMSIELVMLSSHLILCHPLLLLPSIFPSNKVKVKSLSRVWLFVTPWTVAYQDPLSMRFSRQEYWSGLPFPSPEDLPNPGIEPGSPAL